MLIREHFSVANCSHYSNEPINASSASVFISYYRRDCNMRPMDNKKGFVSSSLHSRNVCPEVWSILKK